MPGAAVSKQYRLQIEYIYKRASAISGAKRHTQIYFDRYFYSLFFRSLKKKSITYTDLSTSLA